MGRDVLAQVADALVITVKDVVEADAVKRLLSKTHGGTSLQGDPHNELVVHLIVSEFPHLAEAIANKHVQWSICRSRKVDCENSGHSVLLTQVSVHALYLLFTILNLEAPPGDFSK